MGRAENEQLLATLIADLTAKAELEDLSTVIERFCREQKVDQARGEAVARELKRFLIICSISKNKSYAIRGDIDEMWHMFIMFTRRYQKFCENVSGRFLHHVPTEDIEKDIPISKTNYSYARTLEAYETAFGEPAPSSVWPSKFQDEHGILAPVKSGGGGTECTTPSRGDCSNDCKSYFPPCCNK